MCFLICMSRRYMEETWSREWRMIRMDKRLRFGHMEVLEQ